MTKLLERENRPDHIVIETSGPGPAAAAGRGLQLAGDQDAGDGRRRGDGGRRRGSRRRPLRRRRRPRSTPSARPTPALDHDSPLEELFEDQIRAADLDRAQQGRSDRRGRAGAGARRRSRRATGAAEDHRCDASGELPADVLLGLGAGTEDQIAQPQVASRDRARGRGASTTMTSSRASSPRPARLPTRQTFVDGLKAMIGEHDILRLKGFADVPGKPMRLVVQAVGQRIETYFDRPWGQDEERGTRLVVIGLHDGLTDAVCAAIAARIKALAAGESCSRSSRIAPCICFSPRRARSTTAARRSISASRRARSCSCRRPTPSSPRCRQRRIGWGLPPATAAREPAAAEASDVGRHLCRAHARDMPGCRRAAARRAGLLALWPGRAAAPARNSGRQARRAARRRQARRRARRLHDHPARRSRQAVAISDRGRRRPMPRGFCWTCRALLGEGAAGRGLAAVEGRGLVEPRQAAARARRPLRRAGRSAQPGEKSRRRDRLLPGARSERRRPSRSRRWRRRWQDEGVDVLPVYVSSLKDPVSIGDAGGAVRPPQPDVVINAHRLCRLSPPGAGAAHADRARRARRRRCCRRCCRRVVAGGLGRVEPGPYRARSRHERGAAGVDGRVLSRAVSFKSAGDWDALTEANIVAHEPVPTASPSSRISPPAGRGCGEKPNRDKRVAIVLANYPNRDGRLGNGVGLDTPAGTIEVLRAMAAAGLSGRRHSRRRRCADRPSDGRTDQCGNDGARNPRDAFA